MCVSESEVTKNIFALRSEALDVKDGASPDWEAWDGAHTQRGVHGIHGLTMGCVREREVD